LVFAQDTGFKIGCSPRWPTGSGRARGWCGWSIPSGRRLGSTGVTGPLDAAGARFAGWRGRAPGILLSPTGRSGSL